MNYREVNLEQRDLNSIKVGDKLGAPFLEVSFFIRYLPFESALVHLEKGDLDSIQVGDYTRGAPFSD